MAGYFGLLEWEVKFCWGEEKAMWLWWQISDAAIRNWESLFSQAPVSSLWPNTCCCSVQQGGPHHHTDFSTVKPMWNFFPLELLDKFVVLATYFVVLFSPTIIGSQAGIIVKRMIMLKILRMTNMFKFLLLFFLPSPYHPPPLSLSSLSFCGRVSLCSSGWPNNVDQAGLVNIDIWST